MSNTYEGLVLPDCGEIIEIKRLGYFDFIEAIEEVMKDLDSTSTTSFMLAVLSVVTGKTTTFLRGLSVRDGSVMANAVMQYYDISDPQTLAPTIN